MLSSIAMDMPIHDFENTKDQFDSSGYCIPTNNTTLTTNTLIEDDGVLNLDNWSPPLDWNALYSDQDDLQDLIDTMVMDDEEDLDILPAAVSCEENHCESTAALEDAIGLTDEENNEPDDSKGLRLVHLLMAAAEAISGGDKSRDLARVILLRLRELASPQNGSNMDRLAAYFTEALENLLEGSATVHGKRANGKTMARPHYNEDNNQDDALAAFQLLHDMSPYVKFGHFTANQAILEAVAHHKRIHIVDFDIMEGVQWASLMQALVARENGPPIQHLRITALSRGASSPKFIGTVQETGRRLIGFAKSMGLPFSFHQCKLDSHNNFRPSTLKLVKGEVLVFNCMLHLPHFSYQTYHSVESFLSSAKALGPRLITLAEEDFGPIRETDFVSQFMGQLHHYSTFSDSLKCGFPILTRAQTLVERVYLGPRILRSLAQAYKAHDHESCSWWEWLLGAGYKEVNISSINRCQLKLLLGVFNEGYKVDEMATNKLVLRWNSQPLVSTSIWTCSSYPNS